MAALDQNHLVRTYSNIKSKTGNSANTSTKHIKTLHELFPFLFKYTLLFNYLII